MLARSPRVERAQTISAVEGHCRAGRLGLDELLERSAAAYAARTRAELAALTGDLPEETGGADEPRQRGWRDPAWRLHVTLTVPRRLRHTRAALS